MSRLRDAIHQLDFARRYALVRVETVPLSEWFTIPPGCVSHMGWQVGHIAMAEYRICLDRLRPRTTADEKLISDEFLKAFARESIPSADPGAYPPAAEIRAVYDRVHARILEELPSYSNADLDLPPLKPHPLFNTRYAGLCYAPFHEMIHCGQIAIIRRMLGHKPIW